MMPFCDCTSGGLQLRVIDSAVVASTVRFSGGMLGAATRDCKATKQDSNITNVKH